MKKLKVCNIFNRVLISSCNEIINSWINCIFPELGRRSIYHATHRDAYSGGIVRVYHIKPTGWVNISNEDCMDLHYKYKAEKEAALAKKA